MKLIFLFTVLAVGVQQSFAACTGCLEKVDPNSLEVKATLAQVLLTQNSDDKITKIISVSKQIVAGTRYVVVFETQNQKNNDARLCKSDYVLQPWISKMPQVQSYSCKQL